MLSNAGQNQFNRATSRNLLGTMSTQQTGTTQNRVQQDGVGQTGFGIKKQQTVEIPENPQDMLTFWLELIRQISDELGLTLPGITSSKPPAETQPVEAPVAEEPPVAELPKVDSSEGASGSDDAKPVSESEPATKPDFSAAIIDAADADPNTGNPVTDAQGSPFLGEHGEFVGQVLDGQADDDKIYAVNLNDPQTQQVFESLQSSKGTEAELKTFIDRSIASGIPEVTSDLNHLVQSADPNVRAVNISLGNSKIGVYTGVKAALVGYYQDKATGETLALNDPNLFDPVVLEQLKSDPNVEFVAGNTALKNSLFGDKSGKALDDALVAYVDQQFTSSPVIQQELQNFSNAAKNAADHGINVVVAAGNDHDLLSQLWGHANLQPGADLNFLAQNPNVIVAGSSNAQGRVSDFSARGNDNFKPTVTAVGEQIVVTNRQGEQMAVDGTSFSAPEITETVVRILEENPDLNFDEVNAVLELSATNTTAQHAEEGAGSLNQDTAIQLAGYDRLDELLRLFSQTPNAIASFQRAIVKGNWNLIEKMLDTSTVTV